jgi:uncharacterized protein (DUF305 family)
MKVLRWLAVLAFALTLPTAALSSEYKPAEEEEGHVDAVTYRLLLAAPDDERVTAHMQRDLRYADEMSEHHRGAVRMSESYLQTARGNNPLLTRMAEAIIFNQQFEIGWLEDLRQRVSAGPETIAKVGELRLVRLSEGVTGMEHRQRFQPAPILSVRDLIATSAPVSEYDVMFAKAMRMHHQMALDMAHAYNADPNGGNRVIAEINNRILRDQAVEIGILSDFISRYPGDPDTVGIPPEMHDMMGMPHQH